jgi:hypothetical protein
MTLDPQVIRKERRHHSRKRGNPLAKQRPGHDFCPNHSGGIALGHCLTEFRGAIAVKSAIWRYIGQVLGGPQWSNNSRRLPLQATNRELISLENTFRSTELPKLLALIFWTRPDTADDDIL